ncbi:hypothetical protein D1P53_000915 [Cryptococcus gattii VGV]|nr:hypothetical protein D1P53_000915 [Cryptococcus gattii VGV]
MADLSQHANYTAAYSGLLDNFYLTVAIAGACFLGHEIEVHIPRQRGRDGPRQRLAVRAYNALARQWNRRKDPGTLLQSRRRKGSWRLSSEGLVGGDKPVDPERERLGSRESWEFGYIFQPKAWAVNASRPLPKWPLAWIGTALKFRERDMPAKCGLDLTLHARFLRGCFFYTLLQTLIVMPILMPLHIFYSPTDIASTSMLRASVSSLVQSSGSRWLWVHALLIWWVSITWTCTVLWITWGGLAYRRREIKALAIKVQKERASKRVASGGEEGMDGMALPEDFEGIKRFRTVMVLNIPPDMRDETILQDYFDYYIEKRHQRKQDPSKRKPLTKRFKHAIPIGQSLSYPVPVDVEPAEKSSVEDVVLVRKLGVLINLRSRREEVLKKLEIAHTELAKRVLADVAKYYKRPKALYAIKDPAKVARMSILVEKLGRFTEPKSPHGDQTVWDALHSVPREYLDPYQVLIHSKPLSILHHHNPPLIDYLTTKLSYLTHLLTESLSKPLESYSTASTAFVTFRDAKTARLVLKILDSHPKRSLACKTVPAPDWTDLLWPRLGKSVYRSEFVRGWVVYLGVWVFTLAWIFPVSLLCALASLTNIAGFIKPLQTFLSNNPKAASALTSLAPVILVALLTLAICPILLVIANKAETIMTRLGVHNSVLERFWKFYEAKGHAIATGVLFILTLITKIIITRALKKRFNKLDYEEADILCPPVSATATTVKQGEGDNTAIHYSSDSSDEEDERLDDEESTRQGGKCKTIQRNFGSWTRSRGRHNKPISFRKFIPFDRTIFSSLDSRIQFDPTYTTETPLDDYLDPSTTLPPSPNLDELSIVVPHPPLPPWEDIPPYQRSRGYNDQPAYTDSFEEFLLLQRDPRSTIDLDDCVEMRLALTSSRGGTGVMGDWSLGIEKDNEGFDAEEDKGEGRPLTFRSKTEPVLPTILDSKTDLSLIRSEIWNEGVANLHRRHTEKTNSNLASVFQAPPSPAAERDGAISMQTFSVSSAGALPSDSPEILTANHEPGLSTLSPRSIPSIFRRRSFHGSNDETDTTISPRPRPDSHISFGSLGKSPSARKPSILRPPSMHSTHIRLSPHLKRSTSTYSYTGDSSVSGMSAHQQALLNDVIKEEDKANKDAQREEKEDLAKEKAEVMKEQEKRKKESQGETVVSGVVTKRRTRKGTGLSLNSRNSDRGESGTGPFTRR